MDPRTKCKAMEMLEIPQHDCSMLEPDLAKPPLENNLLVLHSSSEDARKSYSREDGEELAEGPVTSRVARRQVD